MTRAVWCAVLLAGLLSGCRREINFDTVTLPSGQEFRVVSEEDDFPYRGKCALKVTFLSDEDTRAAWIEEAKTLSENYWADKRATGCGVMVLEAEHIMGRLGGLFSQTDHYRVVFDLDGAGHWRQAAKD